MLDGVGWAAGEIVIFMLASLIVGFAIGWVLGRWLHGSTVSEDLEGQLAAERERTKKVEERLNESSTALDKAQLNLKGGKGKAGELQAELDAAQAANADLESQLETLSEKDAEIERLTAEVAGIAGLEAQVETLSEKDAEIERLAAEVAGIADLEAQLSALDDKSAEIGRLSDVVVSCARERDRLAAELAQIEGDVVGRDERIADLEAEIAALAVLEPEAALAPEPDAALAPEPEVLPEPEPEPVSEPEVVAEVVAAPEPEAEAEAESEDLAEPTKEEGMARIAEIAARTAGGAQAADDDLKKVHGIGPKLESTLKDLGITSYRQIANFRTDDIALVTAAMGSFKGRIERDDWMSSAAEQHTRKYNEPA